MEKIRNIASKKNVVILLGIILIVVLALLIITKYLSKQDQPSISQSFTEEEIKSIPSPMPTQPSADDSLKTYTNSQMLLSFEYPSDWDVVESYGLPEGTGISPLNLRFTQPSTDSVKQFNDIQINMAVRKNAETFAFNDLYESRVKAMSEEGIKTEDFTIDGIKGTKYSELGGIASNPYVYLVRSNDDFFFELENQNSEGMLAKAVSREITEEILGSVKFSK